MTSGLNNKSRVTLDIVKEVLKIWEIKINAIIK